MLGRIENVFQCGSPMAFVQSVSELSLGILEPYAFFFVIYHLNWKSSVGF